MFLIDRTLKPQLIKYLKPGRVLMLLGPRRIGKTVLLRQVLDDLEEDHLLLNGEDFNVAEALERRTKANYLNLLGQKRLLVIDEAQKIPEIGKILKLMVDEIENLKILVTGSSAFDITNYTGEPLTGRKKTFLLFPLTEKELEAIESPLERKDHLKQRLVFGNYPELVSLDEPAEKADYLQDLVNSYLLKDILAFEGIRNANVITNLLRLMAFQVGKEVSLNELARQLSISRNTVEKYLDLLTKVFILHRVGGFSRNLRKEVVKSSRWYFYDNGLRNLLTANFNPVHQREDVGELWENYAISERLKAISYSRSIVNHYFWRTYDQQEIDWVEERAGKLFAYAFKWNPAKRPRAPLGWRSAYPEATFEVINPDNFHAWLEQPADFGLA